MITQAVVDQHEQLAGRGDDTDVAAASRSDLVSILPESGMRGNALNALDRSPPDQS
jgi:hypothetical protein